MNKFNDYTIRINQYEITTTRIDVMPYGRVDAYLPKECTAAFNLAKAGCSVYRRNGNIIVIIPEELIHSLMIGTSCQEKLCEIRRYYPKEEYLYSNAYWRKEEQQ